MNTPFRAVEPSFFSYSHTVSVNMQTAHFHDSYEIYYLLSGNRRYLVKNDLFDVYPGDFVLIPNMTIHRTLNIPGEQDDKYHARYLLSPSGDMIPDAFLHLFEHHHYRIPKEQQNAIMACFSDIAFNSKHRDSYSDIANQANLIKILTILARHNFLDSGTQAVSKTDIMMRQAAAYIKENCDKVLTLQSVADHFEISREYFSTKFKSSTGFGFNDYLNQMRVSKASTLLLSTNLPIASISELCGFNDSNYFSKLFHNETGLSPLKYRKTR